MSIRLLTDLVNGSNHKKCLLLSSSKCITQPTLINLNPNEYSQGLQYYPFTVKLYNYNDLYHKLYSPNKTED